MCRCTCGKWKGPSCNGRCAPGGCECHCDPDGPDPDDDRPWTPLPEGPEIKDGPGLEFNPGDIGFEGSEYEFPSGGVVVPQRLIDGFHNTLDKIRNKVGYDRFLELMRPRPGRLDKICIENPFKEFNGVSLPDMRACLDFDELARQEWVLLLRAMITFILVIMFVISVTVTLRQW